MSAGDRKLRNSQAVAAPCRILLVRHATAEGHGRFQGQRDVSLSSARRRELSRLCEKCSHYPIRAVYASDLRRARETAEAVARKFGLEVQARPELREMHFGQWEGLTWNQISRRHPRLASLWIKRFPRQAIPGGEPLGQFRKRIATGEAGEPKPPYKYRCQVGRTFFGAFMKMSRNTGSSLSREA